MGKWAGTEVDCCANSDTDIEHLCSLVLKFLDHLIESIGVHLLVEKLSRFLLDSNPHPSTVKAREASV